MTAPRPLRSTDRPRGCPRCNTATNLLGLGIAWAVGAIVLVGLFAVLRWLVEAALW